MSPTKIYIVLSHYGIVRSISEFLNLTFAQTELILMRLAEYVKEMHEGYQTELTRLK